MWVGEAEEELGQLPAAEVVGEVAHGVGAQDGGVLEVAGLLDSQGFDAQPHKLAHLVGGVKRWFQMPRYAGFLFCSNESRTVLFSRAII